jgi:Ca2+-binding RTX toxin-like protein
MAISTNGTVIARVAGALYNTQLSYATYTEVTGIVTTTATLNALVNDLYARDFASTTDLSVATTLVSNLGLSSVAGLNAWVAAQLTAAGAANKGAKVVELLNSFAQLSSDATYGSAATTFNTKVEAALTASQTAGTVTGTFSEVSTAVAGKTFSLSISTDSVVGGSGDDVINGNLGGTSSSTLTYSSSDVIDGGAGNDTLTVEHNSSGGALSFATVSNVETFNVTETGAATTVTLPTVAGYTNLNSTNSTYDVTFNSIKSATVAVGASNLGATVDVTAAYFSTTLVAGTADNLTVNIESSGTSADPMSFNVTGGTSANVLETVTINNKSGASYVDLDVNEANTTKVVVNATEALTLTLADGAANTLKTIDASGSAAGVSVTAINSKTTITGGAGADTLTGSSGNDTIVAGAGNDSIVGSAGNDSLDAGAGNDTVSIDGSTVDEFDVIAGGEGTDTLKLTAAIGYTATTNTDDGSGVSGFEKINLAGSFTQRMTPLSGNTITGVTMSTASAAGVLTYAPATVAAVTFSANSSLEVSLAANGTADVMAITLAGGSTTSPTYVAATFVDTDGYYDTLTVASNGTDDVQNNTLSIDAAGATSLTITGSQSLELTGADLAAVATIDASGWAGTALVVDASTSTAAVTYTSGTGIQTVTTGTGADKITTGSSADTITSGAGADSISSGAGNDSITSGDGADTVDGGAGNNSISTGTGNDVVTGGADNDTIDGGTGSDSINAGAGNDSITAGTGSDTIEGGAGNDTFVMGTNLSSGDVITDSAGTDSLTATVSANAAPTISGIETLNLRGGVTNGPTLDLTTVTGATSVIAAVTGALTISEAASTLATLTVGGATTDVTVGYATSGPSLLTINLDSVSGSDPDLVITEAEGVKIAQVLTGANVSSSTSRTTYSTSNHSVLDTITANDARTLTISVGSLAASTDVSGDELTTGNVTANTLETLTVSAGGYASLVVNDITSSGSTLSTAAFTADAYGSLNVGIITASSSTTMESVTISAGEAATVLGEKFNFGTDSTIASLSITGGVASTVNLDNASTDVSSIIAGTITSFTLNMGAASALTLNADTTTAYQINSSIGTGSLTFGASVVEDISFGSSTATFGAFTLAGTSTASSVSTLTFDGATMTSFTGSSFGGKLKFDGSGLTGAIGTVTGSNQADTIYGGAGADKLLGGVGADSIVGNAGADTITGGTGADTITGGTGADVYVFAATTDTGTVSGFTAGSAVPTSAITIASLDYITDFATGDTLSFGLTTQATTIIRNSGTVGAAADGAVYMIQGTATSVTSFTPDTSGTATLYVYDADGTGTGSTLRGVVLVGYVDSGSNDTGAATGLIGVA